MVKEENSQASLSAERRRGKQSWMHLLLLVVIVHASPPSSLDFDNPLVSEEHTWIPDLANPWH